MCHKSGECFLGSNKSWGQPVADSTIGYKRLKYIDWHDKNIYKKHEIKLEFETHTHDQWSHFLIKNVEHTDKLSNHAKEN